MWTRAVLVALALAPSWATPAAAQHGEHATRAPAITANEAIDRFVRRAREGTERYRDRSVAIEDGYRRLGPDFPAMGEHWANPEVVSKGDFDAARPGLLTYVQVNGVPTLTGVVYAIPLADGEALPDTPFEAAHWHDHLGTVDEESMLLDHESRGPTPAGMRLAVLHLWTEVNNPAGASVTDNWTLPYVRVGLAAPSGAPVGASRALSLLSGASAYWSGLARSSAAPSEEDQERIDAALAACADGVRGWWARRAPGAPLEPAEVARLDAMWAETWRGVAARVAPPVAQRLAALWRP